MSEEMLEIMRELDRECGITDPLLKTPPAVTDREGRLVLLWDDDCGIPWFREQQRKRWATTYSWSDI